VWNEVILIRAFFVLLQFKLKLKKITNEQYPQFLYYSPH